MNMDTLQSEPISNSSSFLFSEYGIRLPLNCVGGCMEYIEGEINGKFIFMMKLLCKQVRNHQSRGQEDKGPTNQRSVLRSRDLY